MINLYWATDDRYYNPLIDTVPERLISSKEWVSLGEAGGYKKCYSGIHFNKNVFVVRSPFSFEFEQFDDGTYRVNNHDQNWFNQYIVLQGSSDNVIQFLFKEYIFADKSVNMTQLPCYISKNNFTESSILLPGTYDVNKWFRPINCGFVQTKKYITIKEGDPLYYLKFDTDEPIKVIPFKLNEKVKEVSRHCMDVKLRKEGKNLAYLYDKFTNKMQKTVLKEIKNSLL